MRVPGIIHRSDLTQRGIARQQLLEWIGNGSVRRVGRWFVTERAPTDLVALIERGVRPTCLDAASLHGLFVPLHDGVHVYRPRSAAEPVPVNKTGFTQIRRRFDIESAQFVPVDSDRLHGHGLVQHSPGLRSWPGSDPVPDLDLLLNHAARCLPSVKAAVLFESALNKGLITQHDKDRLLACLPQRFSRPLSRVRSDAESGTETAVRWWVESLRVPVRPQVVIPTVGRVDLLIGNSWVIECDSAQFHDDLEQYQRDRARDLRLRALGYTVTRLTWEQVFLQWGETEQMLLGVIRRRDHRRRPAA